MSTAFLRLPFSFDRQSLMRDYHTCVEQEWKAHFNTADFEGSWDGIALRSATGDALDIRALPAATYSDTPLMASCPYFAEVVGQFECAKSGIRLLRLAPGAEIKEHRDLGAGYDSGSFRIHVPVQTSPLVRFRVGSIDLKMAAGECWYADFGLPHRVVNEGPLDRIHLVIDAVRNEWTDALFKEAGYDFEAEKQGQAYPLATKLQMLEHLSAMDNEGAQTLAETLRLEIEAERARPA